MSTPLRGRGQAGIAPDERHRLAASFLSFTLLLACYYILRPVRDALAATLGADSIKYLSSAVFGVMLLLVPAFGWLCARVSRARLVPGLFAFFIVNLAIFAIAFAGAGEYGPQAWWSRAFYVWVTVFNLFAVSLFWSRMADVWSEPQGRRYFGVVSAGGSLGGLVGPLLARTLVANVAISGLMWMSAALLIGALIALSSIAHPPGPRARNLPAAEVREPAAAGVLEGLRLIGRTPFLTGIAALVSLGSLLGMIVYVSMARLVAATYPNALEQTAFYSTRDLWVNGGAFVLQLFLLGQVTRRLGVGSALIGAGSVACIAFVVLGLDPTLATLTGVSVVLRCAEFGLAKPARDMLYTVLPFAAKYQSKNAIDTALYRGSDMASSWIQAVIGRLGLGLGGWGWIAAGLSVVLTAVAAFVGRGYRHRGGH